MIEGSSRKPAIINGKLSFLVPISMWNYLIIVRILMMKWQKSLLITGYCKICIKILACLFINLGSVERKKIILKWQKM